MSSKYDFHAHIINYLLVDCNKNTRKNFSFRCQSDVWTILNNPECCQGVTDNLTVLIHCLTIWRTKNIFRPRTKNNALTKRWRFRLDIQNEKYYLMVQSTKKMFYSIIIVITYYYWSLAFAFFWKNNNKHFFILLQTYSKNILT
jgi:hypothetical protein